MLHSLRTLGERDATDQLVQRDAQSEHVYFVQLRLRVLVQSLQWQISAVALGEASLLVQPTRLSNPTTPRDTNKTQNHERYKTMIHKVGLKIRQAMIKAKHTYQAQVTEDIPPAACMLLLSDGGVALTGDSR